MTESYVEAFWVDLVVHNPFDSEVNLSDLKVIVTGPPNSPDLDPDLVDVEMLDEIVLDPRETRTVSAVSYIRQQAMVVIFAIKDSVVNTGKTTNDVANHRCFIFLPFAASCERVSSDARPKTPGYPFPKAK